MLATKQLTVAIAFHNSFFPILWKTVATVAFVLRRNSEVWNNLRVSKWWQNSLENTSDGYLKTKLRWQNNTYFLLTVYAMFFL